MTTIKYALREVRKHFGRYLPIYAQIITSVLLFAFIAVTFDQARAFSAKMYEYSEHKNSKRSIVGIPTSNSRS